MERQLEKKQLATSTLEKPESDCRLNQMLVNIHEYKLIKYLLREWKDFIVN